MKLFKFLSAFCIAAVFSAEALGYTLEDVIERVNDSVVGVNVKTFEGEQAIGSGVVVDSSGYIITNAHVTDGAEEIMVVTTDDEIYPATLIGTDIKTDIALIKVNEPLQIRPSDFGNSDEVRVGNRVFAIGNPYGLGNSVSMGIISAKERDIEKGPYDSFLQTDAAINQGNSGGPLFNLKGEVVGISTAIFSTNGQNMGLGFATPANIVQWVVEQLKNSRTVVRGWLGISVNTIHSKDGSSHLAITSMGEDTPAAKAGLKVGDIIQEVGEMSLDNPRVFSLGIAQTAPDTVLPIVVEREGKFLDFSVKVIKMPESDELLNVEYSPNKASEKYQLLGIDEEKAKNAEYFPQLKIKAYFDEINKEIVIVGIDDDSDLTAKGVQVGDKFSAVNDKKIFGIEDMRTKIKEAAIKGYITLVFLQNGNIDRVTVKIKGDDNVPH